VRVRSIRHAPQGLQIELHYAVLPALARNKKPDPVFFFAGGPGQSAIDAGRAGEPLLARLGQRRDIVLIDQRGTGRSAPLDCGDRLPVRRCASRPTGSSSCSARDCRAACRPAARRPAPLHDPPGDGRPEAVRKALGAERINLVGGSYGTRAALEYMRQFPQRVRRVVLDGVAPPTWCCRPASAPTRRRPSTRCSRPARPSRPAGPPPRLRAHWQRLLQGTLPRG
jgi:pimeloyl-ACP methyl ester carboxylesterase